MISASSEYCILYTRESTLEKKSQYRVLCRVVMYIYHSRVVKALILSTACPKSDFDRHLFFPSFLLSWKDGSVFILDA